MSAGIVAFLVAISTATWVFTKLQDRTGHGNNKNAVTGAVVVFVIALIVVYTIARSIIH